MRAGSGRAGDAAPRAAAALVERSLRRLGVERLDLVQFHWWDFAVPGFVEAFGWLDELRAAGKIRVLGATNFDAEHLDHLRRAGMTVASNQVQVSLLDRRALSDAGESGLDSGARLLAYGALAGGWLSETWLGSPAAAGEPENRSLVKYRLIVDEIGGWDRLQDVLAALARVARRRGVTIPDVATRWVLEQPGVAAVIAGTSGRAHRLDPFACDLSADDHAELAAALPPSPPGATYALEREPGGRHAAIMRYDLNDQR